MQKIRLGYDFAHPPELIWRYLLDHEGMVRWFDVDSVKMLRTVGKGSVGSVRRLTLAIGRNWPGAGLWGGGPRIHIDEEITGVDPERRLEYHVISGLPFRHHYGIVGLERLGTGCRLSWRVNFSLKTPGFESVLARSMEAWIRRALPQLDRLMRAEYSLTGAPLSGSLLCDDDEPFLEQARERYQRLGGISLRFKKCNSNHYWFARSYHRAQESLLSLVDEGSFIHPGWVLRLMIRFHDFYESNLKLWEGGRRSEVEYHWQEAFAAAELGPKWWLSQAEAALYGLRRAVWAHLCEDLPRALALTYWQYYSKQDSVEYETFAEDFTRIHPIFEVAQRALLRELPARDTKDMLLGYALPERLRHLLLRADPFDIRKERNRAWKRGQLQVQLLTEEKKARSGAGP